MILKKAIITLRENNITTRIDAPVKTDNLKNLLKSLESVLKNQIRDGIIIESIYFYEEKTL